MKKLYLLSCVAVMAMPQLAYSESGHHEHHEEATKHYHAETPKTVAEAKQQFSTTLDKIGHVLEHESLSHSDMEEIHQLSYQLESAFDMLGMKSEVLHDAVEAIHDASEEHQEQQTREAYAALKKYAPSSM